MSATEKPQWTAVEHSDQTPAMFERKDREEGPTHQMWLTYPYISS